jgi:predicted DNA-binding protein (UPF0251 family)
MLKATLLRALTAVRTKIATADAMAADWLNERDRRRRQEAAFLRGIVRLEGSQRKAALVTGISHQTISRILDPDGHAKVRADQAERRKSGPTSENVGPPDPPEPQEGAVPSNVVKLRRRRRPDWQPREPRRTEIHKWFEQYLEWTPTAQATARMLVFNAAKGELPNAAYYDDDEPGPIKGNGTLGSQKGLATRG